MSSPAVASSRGRRRPRGPDAVSSVTADRCRHRGSPKDAGSSAFHLEWPAVRARRLCAVVAVVLGPSLLAAQPAWADDVHMTPTGAGAPGSAFVQKLINWLGQYGLWFALAAMLIGGAVYGVSTYGGNSYQGSRGRTVALAGAAGAVIIGLAPTVINLLFHAANAG